MMRVQNKTQVLFHSEKNKTKTHMWVELANKNNIDWFAAYLLVDG
jgi:hypothetical protein